jgi:NAD-dependent SIR2 family protein deacetylase
LTSFSNLELLFAKAEKVHKLHPYRKSCFYFQIQCSKCGIWQAEGDMVVIDDKNRTPLCRKCGSWMLAGNITLRPDFDESESF